MQRTKKNRNKNGWGILISDNFGGTYRIISTNDHGKTNNAVIFLFCTVQNRRTHRDLQKEWGTKNFLTWSCTQASMILYHYQDQTLQSSVNQFYAKPLLPLISKPNLK